MNRTKIGTIALAATALIALGCGAGPSDSAKDVSTGTSVAPAKGKPQPTPSKHHPIPQEITLAVKVTSKKCFGSAGCNLEFRINELKYIGEPMDPDASYEVSYTYKGLEDPMEGTLTLYGNGKFEVSDTEFGSAKKTAKITATVTAVEKM